MPSPGWYHDPDGGPGDYRYWDGTRWTQGRQAGGAAAPKRTGPRLAIILAAASGVLILALIGWLLSGGLAGLSAQDSPTPIPRQNDGPVPRTRTPSPSPSPSPTPSGGETAPCPIVTPDPVPADPTELRAGGLAAKVPDGWSTGETVPAEGLTRQASALRFAEDSAWASFISVGFAPRSAGDVEPRQTALQLFQCHVTGSWFSGLQDQQSALIDEATTIGGKPGWWMRLRATSSSAPGGGATYDVIVIDRGSPEGQSVFWSGVVDADTAAAAGAEESLRSLRLG